jgi:hypothetical protein
MRWFVFWVSVAVLAVVATAAAAYLAFNFVPAIGRPSVAAFHESLADETGGHVDDGFVHDDRCRSLRRTGLWRCQITDPGTSSVVEYELRTRGRRCWNAHLLSRPAWDGPEPPPLRTSGCVTIGDQFWGLG